MQEHLAGESGRRAPSWYLARGDKRYGPLADRELLPCRARRFADRRSALEAGLQLLEIGARCLRCYYFTLNLHAEKRITSGRRVSSHRGSEQRASRSAQAADVSGTVKPKSLERWSTDELQTAIYSGMLDNVQGCEAGRILRERELAPDRKLARRVYNNTAWTLAFSLGTFIVALAIFWLIATAIAYRKPTTAVMASTGQKSTLPRPDELSP